MCEIILIATTRLKILQLSQTEREDVVEGGKGGIE